MQYNIEVFCDNDLNANTYLIYNDSECLIIDPANNIKTLLKYVNGRTIKGILLTHGHYDHFKTLKELLKETNSLVYMHKNAYLKLKDPKSSYAGMFGFPYPTDVEEEKIHFVKDNELISLGTFNIKCWYTPGHTDCMMCFILDNNLLGEVKKNEVTKYSGLGAYEIEVPSVIDLEGIFTYTYPHSEKVTSAWSFLASAANCSPIAFCPSVIGYSSAVG